MQRMILCAGMLALLAGAAPAEARRAAPRRTAAAAPKRPSAKVLAAAKARFKQGRAYYEAGAWSDAITEYEAAYRLAPLPLLLFNIGQAYRMKGDKAQAIAAYQRYLTVVTEGSVAEEARNHIAALKLRLQVEAAEAARRRAEAEVEAVRRRAAEAEAMRRRAEAEAQARIRAQRGDAERLKGLAAEIAARTQAKKRADQQEYRRRLTAAEVRGHALRASGIAAMVTGAVTLAASTVCVFMMQSANDKLKDWGSEPEPWSEKLDHAARDKQRWFDSALGMTITGAALLVGGGIVYRVGVYLRDRAVGAVERPVTLTPSVGPGGVGVTLQGRF